MSERAPLRQEEDRVGRRRVIVAGAAGIAITLLASLVPWLMIAARRESRPVAPLASAPTLLESDAIPAASARERQRRELSRYAWIDEERGLARIPIEEAMLLLVENER